MTQKDYEQYIAEGPDSLSTEAVKRALGWRDENPVEAFAIRSRHELQRRESEAEEMARETWIRDGGDASQFAAAWRELSAEERKERLRRSEEEAHASAWRSFTAGF